MAKKARTKKKESKNIASGVVHIQSTFNNTIVTDHRSRWQCSCLGQRRRTGIQGLTQKHTFCGDNWQPKQAAKKAMEHGMRSVEVYVKGPGAGTGIGIALRCRLPDSIF